MQHTTTTNQPIYLVEFTDTDHTIRYSASHNLYNATRTLYDRSSDAPVRYVAIHEMTPEQVVDEVLGDGWEDYGDDNAQDFIDNLGDICYGDCAIEVKQAAIQAYKKGE